MPTPEPWRKAAREALDTERERYSIPQICRCGHDHLDPPWRAGDENICNATIGPLICGCSEFISQNANQS